MEALMLLIIFLVMILIGVPIYFAMGLAAVYGLTGLGWDNMVVIPQKMFAGMNNFTYLCIPLFVLAGEIMSKCGLLLSIVELCNAMVGHIRGGLAQVNVLASMLFAGISGSATADATSIGKVEIEMMNEAGYDTSYSAGVTAASAIIGPIIPPSNIMIIYAVCAGNVSVAAMFLGGIIPGITLGLTEMLLCYLFAIKFDHPRGEKCTWKTRLKVGWKALPALGLPLVILGGIVSGIFTATEASAIAVFYALIVALVKRSITFKSFYECCLNASITTANVLAIIGIAASMCYAITVLQIPQSIVAIFSGSLHTKFAFLIFCNILLLILGFFLDQAPALLIMTPILLPMALELGIDPVHFGILICFNLTIGLITPPVGMTLFVTANVAKVKLTSIFKEIVPFVIVGLVVLMMITFIPAMTTFVPSLFY